MRKFLLSLILFVPLFFMTELNAQERRPIDNRHPLWMIHIDVWNNADPQKIIDLIPADIKPYVCFNLSMSCSYDTDLKIYKKPQNAIQTFKSWASVCCFNNVWFTCQPASGGHTHIKDNDLETFEYFFKEYKNFLGWNYCEQFWGFDEPNDASSSKAVDRIALFAKLVPMSHQYGGFLTISFCGNIWSHPLNPIGMMKRNSNFLNACKSYPDAMLFLYKYTTSANWFNNESVTIGPFVTGLAKSYGVRYDNCGWNGAIDELCKDDGKTHNYPGAVGIAPVLEQMTLNGACVWDGPELIWTEDFRELGRSTVDGYTRRNWGTYPNFDNIWLDMFRKVIDGSIHIATREEVVQRTKIVIQNNISAEQDGTSLKVNAYAAPLDLYHGLYLQEDDPFNQRSSYESGFGNLKGYGNNNFLYLKKTGRYPTIPVVMGKYDSLANTIPNYAARTAINNKRRWPDQAAKIAEFNRLYPEISKGDLFVARLKNQLTCYFPYSYMNKKKKASALIPLQYNTCDTLSVECGLFGSAIVSEYEDKITIYANNYRADSTANRTDKFIIYGAKEKPSYTYKKRTSASTGSVTENWDELTGRYTITLSHNGSFDITVNCSGNGTDKLTDYVDNEPLTDLPPVPEDFYGALVIEGEDMDFKSINNCVTDQYNSNYRSTRGHSGMGFAVMGTSTSSALSKKVNINFAGTYNVIIKYQTDRRFAIHTSVNGGTLNKPVLESTGSGWSTVSYQARLNAGMNSFLLLNPNGRDFKVDNVTFEPVSLDVLSGEQIGYTPEFEDYRYYSIDGYRQENLNQGLNIEQGQNGSHLIFVE